MKSISITRLKRESNTTFILKCIFLEMKSISITRLKLVNYLWCLQEIILSWNEKHLDYEIETHCLVNVQLLVHVAWNEKHLDYEIETKNRQAPSFAEDRQLEMKSISITRLKHVKHHVYSQTYVSWNEKHLDYEIETKIIEYHVIFYMSWNEKHLDYEIETSIFPIHCSSKHTLEMKSISITRLKRSQLHITYRWLTYLEMKSISITRLKRMVDQYKLSLYNHHLKWKASRLRDWNFVRYNISNFLYSLEMKSISITRLKHKDVLILIQDFHDLKWKASRLRDWNVVLPLLVVLIYSHLKWKASRLRDWNWITKRTKAHTRIPLEMKSISITRLKQPKDFYGRYCFMGSWNEKHLDYEIETCSE